MSGWRCFFTEKAQGNAGQHSAPHLSLRPDRDRRPHLQSLELQRDTHDRMPLDVLTPIKSNIDGNLSFRHSCHEGICGTNAMNINGKNGLACITRIDDLEQPIVIRPLSGFPVVRDLIVDLTEFFKQYHSIKPHLINDSQPSEKERLRSPENETGSTVYMNASCARAASVPVLRTGGTPTSSWAQPDYCKPIVSWPKAEIYRAR